MSEHLNIEMSAFEELLLRHPTSPWDWTFVSTNPSVSFEFILEHPEMSWDPKYVSRNISVTEDHVRNNLSYPWDYRGLCMNPNLSFEFFDEFIIKPVALHRVDWHLLSANSSVTVRNISENIHYKWNDKYLSMNPNITSNYILNEGKSRHWFVPFVSANPGITESDIFKSRLKKMFDWDYTNLSANVNLPMVYVNDNPDNDWNYHSISMRANMIDIQNYHRVKWDAMGLSLNPNITFDFVLKNPQISWHRPSLLMNPAISLDAILDNASWFGNIIYQPNSIVCSNPTITKDWIEENSYYVDWARLSNNSLIKK